MSLAVLLVAAACTVPDTPPSLSRRLSADVVRLVDPDTVRTVRLGPATLYRYLWSGRGPWAIHIVESELGRRCDLVLDVLQAAPRETGGRGHERVSSMVRRAGVDIVVAVNADFFTPEGGTLGTEVVDGRVVSARARPVLAWRPGRAPWMGPARVDPGVVRMGWAVPRVGGDGDTEAVGGFPELLDSGRRVGDLRVEELPGFAAARHPRTGVGYHADSGRLWIVVVDGRQPSYSMGMTMPELTSLFEALGAEEALNLDGGGSSVMIAGGIAVSRPSDTTGERPVVNALALRRVAGACDSG